MDSSRGFSGTRSKALAAAGQLLALALLACTRPASPRLAGNALAEVPAGEPPAHLNRAAHDQANADALAAFRAAIASSKRQIELELEAMPRGGGENAKLDAQRYQAVIVATLSRLTATVTDSRLSAVRSLIEREYPEDLDVLYPRGDNQHPVVSADEARRSLLTQQAYLDGLQNPTCVGGWVVSLEVASVPLGAEVVFETKAHFEVDRKMTRTRFRLYRGDYNYSVEKQGFQRITGPIDLWDNCPTRMECRLIPNRSGERATLCAVR